MHSQPAPTVAGHWHEFARRATVTARAYERGEASLRILDYARTAALEALIMTHAATCSPPQPGVPRLSAGQIAAAEALAVGMSVAELSDAWPRCDVPALLRSLAEALNVGTYTAAVATAIDLGLIKLKKRRP